MKAYVVLVVLLVATMANQANAGWLFGRRAASCQGGSCSTQSSAQRVTVQVAPQPQATRVSVSVTAETATAQGVANIMARLGRVGHFGGHRWYEGCGSGPSPQAAYNICCYANSGLKTYDVGYAQGRNGMWYCCRRYRP